MAAAKALLFFLPLGKGWGGNLVWRGGRWHMAVSEMRGHCGLASWQHNSFVRHASASTVHGPFEPHEASPANQPSYTQCED